MTKEQKIKLHTAMLSDNEHRCNSLNNYIHTDEYLTAEVVKVVEEIVAAATKELQEENERLKTDYKVLSCSVGDFGELQENLEEEQRKNNGLEEQISILLSCKNCPDNKGGYICEKEYNDKCIAQKIQYIKELQEEVNNLNGIITAQKSALDKEYAINAQLQEQIEEFKKCENCKHFPILI